MKNALLAALGGAFIQRAGELLAILEKKAGLELVARTNPGVVAGSEAGFSVDEAEGGGPGPADLAGFLGELEARRVVHPAPLIKQQPRAALGCDLRVALSPAHHEWMTRIITHD